MSLDLDALFQNADDPAWRDLIRKGGEASPIRQGAEPAVYRAVFTSPAGKAVLEDLVRRYVYVTRCIPGEGSDAAFYREGMAQVVHDIVLNMTEEPDGEEG